MKNENLNTLTNNFWKVLLESNGTTVKLITKTVSKINNGRPIVFTFDCTFSGEKNGYNISDKEIEVERFGIVKILLSDLLETKQIVDIVGGETYEYSLPSSNLNSFIENVVIDGISYKIKEEKKNGFNNLMVLRIIRR